MKKQIIKVSMVLMAASVLFSSCIGSFSLFNKYEKWQTNMTGNKYVNGIVGFILQPIVGSVCLFVDALVLNTIEFWTGNNPVGTASTQHVKGTDGHEYAIRTLKNGYKITSDTGEVTLLSHNKKTDAWYISQNGEKKELIRFNADGTIQANLGNGQSITVSNDEAGMRQVKDAMNSTYFYALN